MELIKGDLWEEIGKADLLLVTTNSMLNSKGELIMGAGAARQAKQRYPELPRKLGYWLQQMGQSGMEYNLLPSGISVKGTTLMAFQTKIDWRDNSDLDLIRRSCQSLARVAEQWKRVAMNYPGIGLGGCPRDVVEAILEDELGESDNVCIYWR